MSGSKEKTDHQEALLSDRKHFSQETESEISAWRGSPATAAPPLPRRPSLAEGWHPVWVLLDPRDKGVHRRPQGLGHVHWRLASGSLLLLPHTPGMQPLNAGSNAVSQDLVAAARVSLPARPLVVTSESTRRLQSPHTQAKRRI